MSGDRDSALAMSSVEAQLAPEIVDGEDHLLAPLDSSAYRDVAVITNASSAVDSSDADDDGSSGSGTTSESSPPPAKAQA